MSVQLTPVTFDLSEESPIWLRNGEDFKIQLGFQEDISSAVFVLSFEEFKWPFRSAGYSTTVPSDITTGFVISDNGKIVNGLVSLLIPASTVESWNRRKFFMKLKVTKDGRTWIAAQRVVTTAEGT